MGWLMESVMDAVRYLRDPHLVRRIQEAFGLKVIVDEEENEHQGDDQLSRLARRGLKSLRDRREEAAGNGVLKLATQAIGRRRKRRPVSPPSSPHWGSPEREIPEVTIETCSLIDLCFKLATTMGYEPFYITFLPYLVWNVDMLVARHLIVLWALSMYIGQAAKCLIKWKRPSAPPAIRLEDNPVLEQEYGFPSTHAIVCTTVPFYLLYLLPQRYEISFWVMMCISVSWWLTVCISRVYLGVHSVMDIIGGVVVSAIMLLCLTPLLPTLDSFILHSPSFPAVSIVFVLFMIYIYPVEDHWTMDRGDTCAIVGASLGFCISSNLHSPCPDDFLPGPFPVYFPSLIMIGLCITRFVVGILLLVPTRFVMKLLCFRLLPAIMPSHGVEEVAKRPLVELPYKLITYGAIGFNSVCLCERVFEISSINRW